MLLDCNYSGFAGAQALWRGTLAGQLLYIPYTTVQFVTLQQARAFVQLGASPGLRRGRTRF